MKYKDLDERSKKYVDRYIRTRGITREDALKLAVVKEVIRSYKEDYKDGNM